MYGVKRKSYRDKFNRANLKKVIARWNIMREGTRTGRVVNWAQVCWKFLWRKLGENADPNKSHYYSFKIFPRFWLAKSTHLIHHYQLLMTKFGRILCLARKWRQKCSVLCRLMPVNEEALGTRLINLVPRGRDPFGQRQGLSTNGIL